MTAAQYYEMCEMLGESVVEENVPVELDDLPLQLQSVLVVYNQLQDNWDTMGGNYLGKVKYNLKETFELLGVDRDDYREYFTLINLVDRVRSELILQRKQQKEASSK